MNMYFFQKIYIFSNDIIKIESKNRLENARQIDYSRFSRNLLPFHQIIVLLSPSYFEYRIFES